MKKTGKALVRLSVNEHGLALELISGL